MSDLQKEETFYGDKVIHLNNFMYNVMYIASYKKTTPSIYGCTNAGAVLVWLLVES